MSDSQNLRLNYKFQIKLITYVTRVLGYQDRRSYYYYTLLTDYKFDSNLHDCDCKLDSWTEYFLKDPLIKPTKCTLLFHNSTKFKTPRGIWKFMTSFRKRAADMDCVYLGIRYLARSKLTLQDFRKYWQGKFLNAFASTVSI